MTDPTSKSKSDRGEYPPRFLEGIALYGSGRFWEAHEAWEDLWRAAGAPEKELYQGLIQIAAAMIHTGKAHWDGAANLLKRAAARLEKCPDALLGLDVAALRGAVHRRAEELEAAGGARQEFKPLAIRIDRKE